MRFGSVCSGIEAASVAWLPLGWQCAWLSEIDPFANAVLAHHYPDVPNYGDMRTLPQRILDGEIEAPDLLCGGTPCQAFSIAGLRQSLDDERGNLSLVFIEVANAIDTVRARERKEPCIIFWENVPGVLNTKDNAFGCFLAGLAGGDVPFKVPTRWSNAGVISGGKRQIAWRLLDAQYFGVAQRRKRVFVIASSRAGFDPSKVLFERPCMQGDTRKSAETGKDIATYAEVSFGEYSQSDLAPSIKAAGSQLAGGGEALVLMDQGGKSIEISHDQIGALRAEARHPPIVLSAYNANMIADTYTETNAIANSVTACGRGYHGGSDVLLTERQGGVRRLTPKECERLQGFPDDYTLIPYRGKPKENCPDGPRYKALGNSWAVPVVRWIGERIVKNIKGEL